MRRISEYDENGCLIYCTVVTDIDNGRVGVFTSGQALVDATVKLSLQGILYHVAICQFAPSERPHRKAVESGYLKAIADTWLLDEKRVAYYQWLRDQKAQRLEQTDYNNKFKEKIENLKKMYSPSMRERYDNE